MLSRITMEYYLFKLLEEIIKKKIKIKHSCKPITGKEQKNYNNYLIQEKLLVKILNERFNLNVDTTLMEMEIVSKKEDL